MKVGLWPLALLAGFVALTALLVSVPIGTNDLWLHLTTGEWMLHEGRVPHVDAYTFTRAGAPYVAHEWLVQVLFALLYRASGLPALSLLYAVLVGGILAASYWSVARRAGREAALVTTAGVFCLLGTGLSIRPHVFTFLLVALYSALLPDAWSEDRRRRVLAWCALLALQVLWANLHGAFVLGILLAAIHAISAMIPTSVTAGGNTSSNSAKGTRALRNRTRLVALALPVALAAVSCLNAYGTQLYVLVSKFSDPVFRQAIVEWQSPFTSRFAGTPLFACYLAWMVAAAAAAWSLARRRREIEPALLLLVFGAMSVSSQRHIGLLALVTAPAVGTLLARGPVLAARGAALLLLLVAAVTPARALARSGTSPGLGRVAPNTPLEAVERMREEGLRGRVFTPMAFGSYVTWRGWPELTTSVDSRLEVFGGDFLLEHLAAQRDPARFAAFAARWPFQFALLPWRSPAVRGAVAALDPDPHWTLVYFDDIAALYARRTPENDDLIRRRGYRWLRPSGVLAGASPAELLGEVRRAAAEPPSLPHRPPVNTRARGLLRGFR
jgi:hypothetical protein